MIINDLLIRCRVAETKKTIDLGTTHTIVSSFQNFDTDGLVISLTFDVSIQAWK
jgi:hypothetical protein